MIPHQHETRRCCPGLRENAIMYETRVRDLQCFEALVVEHKELLPRKLAYQRIEHLLIPNAIAVENNAPLRHVLRKKAAQGVTTFLLGWQVWKRCISPRSVDEHISNFPSNTIDGRIHQ